MVTTLNFSKIVNINIGEKGAFKIGEEKLNIKDIPILRFRMQEYSETVIEFIKKTISKFPYSAGLVEIEYNTSIDNNILALSGIEKSVAMYMYINIDDSSMMCDFSQLQITEEIENTDWDRVMIRDRTTKLYTVRAEEIKAEIAEVLDMEIRDIGICKSPLSFGENACLTAVKARELIAMYCESDEGSLPSANHQVGNCGCVRGTEVGVDIVSISSGVSGSKKGNADSSVSKKSSKKILSGGMSKFRF